MARTSLPPNQTDARERARSARLRVDAEREERGRKVEQAATDYFLAVDAYTEITRQLVTVDDKMATAVGHLLDLRETPARIVDLLGVEAKQIRRLGAQRDRRADEAAREPATEPHHTISHD